MLESPKPEQTVPVSGGMLGSPPPVFATVLGPAPPPVPASRKQTLLDEIEYILKKIH